MVLAWFPITSSWKTACYIQGLIHGIGRGVPNDVRIVFVLTKSMSVYSKDPKANQQGKDQDQDSYW